jgi:hypothetical protein
MAEEIVKTKRNWMFWTTRIIAIIFIVFLSSFSLDVFFVNGYGFWETLLAFLMHNIPVFILVAALWISWKKHEWFGGTIFIALGIYYLALMMINATVPSLIVWSIASIACPAILIGILFFVNWYKKR